MITLDKIKVITKAEYVKVSNDAVFETRENKMNNFVTYVFNQKQPFNLFIQLTPRENKCIIEFSSKILLDDYPKLISINTIYQCFENISKMGLCELQIENIINECILISCDVTTDLDEINYPTFPDNIRLMLISNLKNVSKFHIQKYGTAGYTIIKDVKTGYRKIRLLMYDKYSELNKASNRNFMSLLHSPDLLLYYFQCKYRLETNFNTLEQIREYCQTNDTSLINVLNSKANPLLKVFDAVFSENEVKCDISISNKSSIFDYETLNQLKDALLLRECEGDIQRINDVCNYYLSPKTNKRKYLAVYRKLLGSSPEQCTNRLIIGQIRDKLSA